MENNNDKKIKSKSGYFNRGIEFTSPITFGEYNNGYDEYQSILRKGPYIPDKFSEDDRVNINSFGTRMEIIDYKNNKNITVLLTNVLPDGNIIYYIRYGCRYEHFKSGGITSPYELSVKGIGYLGEGNYNSVEYKKEHTTFKEMMKKCSDEGFTVDPFFWDFQNFCSWCQFSYYEIANERMEFLEDIFNISSKHFHPYTSVFVPQRIKILMKSTINISIPGEENKSGKTYRVQCMINDKRSYLGSFGNRRDALLAWKLAKEDEIKRVANEYWFEKRGQFIPQFKMIYEAMMNHQINIDIL